MGPSINPANKPNPQNSIFKYLLNKMRVFYSDNGDPINAQCETEKIRFIAISDSQFHVITEGCSGGAGSEMLNYSEKENGEIEIDFYPGPLKNIQGVQMTTLNKKIRCHYLVDSEIRIQKINCTGIGSRLSSDRHFELMQFAYTKDQQSMLTAEAHVFKDLQDLVKKVTMKVPFAGKINIIEEEIPLPDYSVKPPLPAPTTPTKPPVKRRDAGPSDEDLRHEAELREAAKIDGQEPVDEFTETFGDGPGETEAMPTRD
jgi:hypothetical protein